MDENITINTTLSCSYTESLEIDGRIWYNNDLCEKDIENITLINDLDENLPA